MNKKILIVSQKNIITNSIREFCEEQGDDVLQVERGSQALQLLFVERYDLIICSVFIEDYDGVQLAIGIKCSFALNSTTPVAMITSNNSVSEFFTKETMPELILLKDGGILDKFQEFYLGLNLTESRQRVRLLYIDDDKFVHKIITSWFSKVLYIELVMCESISELKSLSLSGVQVIVSDNILSDGNIYDVVEVIQTSEIKDTPIIVYTGSTDKIDLARLQIEGNIFDVLAKPFNMKHFFQVLDELRIKSSN